MLCAIMQPTYLPWCGYFHLIDRADCFIFLDDVQFERRSWQSRNRIALNGQECMLTVPTRKTPRCTPLNQIAVSEHIDWRTRHARSLSQAYGKHPHGSDVLDQILPMLEDRRIDSLVELTTGLTRVMSNALGLETRFELASSMRVGGRRTEHLQRLCHAIGARHYLSAPGSKGYLERDGFTDGSGLTLEFSDFIATDYPQRGVTGGFISHLSLVDVWANMGRNQTVEYIRRRRL